MNEAFGKRVAAAARAAGAAALQAARVLWHVVRVPLIGALNVL
jgi:hypothetical protein